MNTPRKIIPPPAKSRSTNTVRSGRSEADNAAVSHRAKARPLAAAVRPTPSRRTFFIKLAIVGIAVIGTTAALDLTQRSSGYMNLVTWVPKQVADWADSNGQFRNLPAFFLLALPFLALGTRKRHRLITAGALCAFAAALEFSQYFLPNRWVEWQDIAWSWVGIVAAWFLFESARYTLKQLRSSKTVKRLIARAIKRGTTS